MLYGTSEPVPFVTLPWTALEAAEKVGIARDPGPLGRVLCRPYGTRVMDEILPGTAVPGYRLLRPCGTGVVAVSKSLRTSQQARKDAVAERR